MKIKRVIEKEDLDKVFSIRKAVFVDEQEVPLEDEFDEYEDKAEHILLYYKNEPAATGRLRIIKDTAKIERICVMSNFRKHGFGKIIVEYLETIAKEKGIDKAKLHGQTYAIGFYEKLGYIQDSQEFMEDGIPHVKMIKNL